MIKKYLSYTAAVLAALSCLPATAFAADARQEEDTSLTQEDTPWWEEEDDSQDDQQEDDQESSGQEDIKDQNPLRALINGAQLDPKSADSGELQRLVDDIIQDITDDDMDTYEKVLACYDYLTENVTYGSHMRKLSTPVGETTCASIYSSYGEVEGFGAVALSARTGLCNAYASAFILMTQSLGLDGHLVTGKTGSARGGFAYHEWAEIDIGDETYVFDPQLEQDLTQAGLPAYSVFCKTYDQVSNRYIRGPRKL